MQSKECKVESGRLEVKVKELGEENRRQQRDMLALKDQLRTLRSGKADADQKLDQSKKEAEVQKSELQSYRTRREALEDEVSTLRTQNQAVLNKLERARSEHRLEMQRMQQCWDKEKTNFREERQKMLCIQSFLKSQPFSDSPKRRTQKAAVRYQTMRTEVTDSFVDRDFWSSDTSRIDSEGVINVEEREALGPLVGQQRREEEEMRSELGACKSVSFLSTFLQD